MATVERNAQSSKVISPFLTASLHICLWFPFWLWLKHHTFAFTTFYLSLQNGQYTYHSSMPGKGGKSTWLEHHERIKCQDEEARARDDIANMSIKNNIGCFQPFLSILILFIHSVDGLKSCSLRSQIKGSPPSHEGNQCPKNCRKSIHTNTPQSQPQRYYLTDLLCIWFQNEWIHKTISWCIESGFGARHARDQSVKEVSREVTNLLPTSSPTFTPTDLAHAPHTFIPTIAQRIYAASPKSCNDDAPTSPNHPNRPHHRH